MNKLIAALIAGAFAVGSVAAMADDKTPPIPVDTAKLKAEREKAKADYANMTPEQREAYKKGMAAQKRKWLSEDQLKAMDAELLTPADAAAAKAAKAQPKALPNAAAKENALEQQQKKASGQ